MLPLHLSVIVLMTTSFLAVVSAADNNATAAAASEVLMDLNFAGASAGLFGNAPDSKFQWMQTDSSVTPAVVLDDAVFSSDKDTLYMAAQPFNRWIPQSAGVAAAMTGCNTAAVSKEPFAIGEDEVLEITMRLKCETFDAGKHKFAKEAVKDATDDFRLASCGFYVMDKESTGIRMGIVLTNLGIWGSYERMSPHFLSDTSKRDSKYRAYTIYHYLSNRTSVDEIVDATIKINRMHSKTKFYLNDTLIWKVYDGWGAPRSAMIQKMRNRLLSLSDGDLMDVSPARYWLEIGLGHRMDLADPNNLELIGDDNRALVRYTSVDDYYGKAMKFWDEQNLKENSLYGQGAKIGLQRLVVERMKGRAVVDEADAANKEEEKKSGAAALDARDVAPK